MGHDEKGRYVPDPRQVFLCVYCNKCVRLVEANVVIDSYLNPCHLACFDRNVAHLVSPGTFESADRSETPAKREQA